MPAASSKDPRFFLQDTSPTILDKDIKTSKLSTHKHVLLNFLAHRDELLEDGKATLRKASKKTSDIVVTIYLQKSKHSCGCSSQNVQEDRELLQKNEIAFKNSKRSWRQRKTT